jgi:hypothetical protein
MPSFLLPLPPINSFSNLVKVDDITFNFAKNEKKNGSKKKEKKK